MFTLYLDGKLAVIKKDSSFKLTRENPFLKDAGDYTLDVVLPLSVSYNLEIFGLASRLDVNKKKILDTRYKFILHSDNISLEGTATVTEINNNEIKIQLVAGVDDLTIKSKKQDGTDIYVDELDLGQAYKELYIRETGSADGFNMKNLISLFFKKKTDTFDPDSYMYGLHTQTECVCYPIFSDADSNWSNKRILLTSVTNLGPTSLEYSYWMWELNKSEINHPTSETRIVSDDLVLAPQPYFYIIIERVLKALGYTVVRDDIKNSWMADIFIANARGSLDYSFILPHWTIYDFLKEVRAFFGVDFLVDGKNISIINKIKNQGLESLSVIKDVIDDFTITVDSDTQQLDSSFGNVDYDIEVDKWLKLPDEVYQRAEVKHFANLDQARDFADSLSADDFKASKYLFKLDDDNSTFAIVTDDNNNFALREVDMMSALFRRDSRDIDVKMRIVPCNISDSTTQEDFYYSNPTGSAYTYNSSRDINFLSLKTSDARVINGIGFYSVNDAIHDDTEDNDKQDIIEVALNIGSKTPLFLPSHSSLEHDVPFSYGIPYAKDWTGVYTLYGTKHLMLSFTGEGISRDALNSSLSFDSRGKICVSFIDEGTFTPENIYIIGGKKYICEKLEFTISENGTDKIKKGYFYPLS